MLDINQEAASLFSKSVYSLDIIRQGPLCPVYGLARLLTAQTLLLAINSQTNRGKGLASPLPNFTCHVGAAQLIQSSGKDQKRMS